MNCKFRPQQTTKVCCKMKTKLLFFFFLTMQLLYWLSLGSVHGQNEIQSLEFQKNKTRFFFF